MFCTEQKVSQLSAKRFFSILTVLTPGWVGSYSHGHSQCLTSYSSIEAEYEMMQERTLKLSASLKVRVIQILSLNTPQTPSCEGCRKPIQTNLSHVNKADFEYSGGVLSKEEGKIGWQIIDSRLSCPSHLLGPKDTQIAAANQLRIFSTRKWFQVYTTHLSYSPQLNLGFFFRKNGTEGQTLSPLINYRQQKCSRIHRYTVKLSRINQMLQETRK